MVGITGIVLEPIPIEAAIFSTIGTLVVAVVSTVFLQSSVARKLERYKTELSAQLERTNRRNERADQALVEVWDQLESAFGLCVQLMAQSSFMFGDNSDQQLVKTQRLAYDQVDKYQQIIHKCRIFTGEELHALLYEMANHLGFIYGAFESAARTGDHASRSQGARRVTAASELHDEIRRWIQLAFQT